MTIFQKREKRKRAVYSAASSMLIHLSLAISDIFAPPDGLCITIQPSDKLQFVGSFTLCSIFHPPKMPRGEILSKLLTQYKEKATHTGGYFFGIL